MAKVKFLKRVDFGKGPMEAGGTGDVPDQLVEELVAAEAIEVIGTQTGKKPEKS